MKKKILALAFGMFFGISAAAEAETVIKIGHFGPGDDIFSKSVIAFATELEKQSEGRLKAQIFPAGQLGNEKQQISALQGGLQEMLITASTNLTNLNAPLRLLDLPFIFGSEAQADSVTMGPLAPELLSGLGGSGLVGLAFWENGFRVMSNSVRPITKPDDLAGIKMRVIGAPVFIDTFSALGAQPIPMPFPELYAGLETGTVNAQDNTALTIEMMKYYEVQKYLTITNHIYSAMVVLAGQPFLDRLSPEDREILEKVTVEFGGMQREMMREANKKVLDFLGKDGGMEIIPALSPESLAAFRAAVAPVVDKTVTDDLKPMHEKMLAATEATK
ncbi:MAG: hypothetical protein RLZZ444_3913 [Pseudomonadota bacterium]